MPALSFVRPSLPWAADGMTKRRVENPVCANGLKGGPACGTLHVQIMGHVASVRCQRQGLSSQGPSRRRRLTRGWRGDGRWRMAPILIGRSLFFALCSRALARKHGKENRLTRSLQERQWIVPLLHISGPLGQENTLLYVRCPSQVGPLIQCL